MDWLVNKYIGIVSTRLEKFKRKSGNICNFRCPLCGDSESHKNKARAYFYEKQGTMMFHCHNCTSTMAFVNFMKTIDVNLYNEYKLEKIKDNKTPEQLDLEAFIGKMKKPLFLQSGPLKGLKKISQLNPEHSVKKFVDKRKIPNPYHAKMFSCPNFMNFVNGIIPDKFSKESLEKDETRLLIPFFDKDKNVFAFQGRSLGKSEPKYITIILDETKPKLFGLDTVDFSKIVYVFEGPIDSMFISNSIATAGGDLISSLGKMDKSKLVIVYDNEPRSRETIKKLDKAILNGYNVCIWPENFEHKDINDAVLAGLSSEFIEYIIKTNTHKDLKAKLALAKWSKV
jgi:hypothetical protein